MGKWVDYKEKRHSNANLNSINILPLQIQSTTYSVIKPLYD